MRKKHLTYVALLIVGSLFLAACAPPPPLRSDKYLDDTSIVSSDATHCGPPCFHDITLNKTTFTDAVTKIKADKAFSAPDVKDTDNPPNVVWSTAAGEQCCVITADPKTGLVNQILVKLSPKTTIKQVIDKLGTPKYVFATDYSQDEVTITVVFPEQDIVVWVVPGDGTSSLKETDPVVMTLYLNDSDFQTTIKSASLQAWNGYLPYQTYKNATPVVTPVPTFTPTPG